MDPAIFGVRIGAVVWRMPVLDIVACRRFIVVSLLDGGYYVWAAVRGQSGNLYRFCEYLFGHRIPLELPRCLYHSCRTAVWGPYLSSCPLL